MIAPVPEMILHLQEDEVRFAAGFDFSADIRILDSIMSAIYRSDTAPNGLNTGQDWLWCMMEDMQMQPPFPA